MDLQEYDYVIQHMPGKNNIVADALSRPSEVDQGKEDNQNITVIPPTKFIDVAIIEDNISKEDKQCFMILTHNHPSTGHPGRDKTI